MATNPQNASLAQKIVQAAEKKVVQGYEQEVETRMQSGQDPKAILTELMNSLQQDNSDTSSDPVKDIMALSQTQVPVKQEGLLGGKKGIMGALNDVMQGGEFHPMAPKTEAIGFDNAVQLYGAKQKASMAPLEQQEKKTNIAKSTIEMMKGITELTGVNPLTGESQQDKIVKQKTAEVEATKRAENKVAREKSAQDLQRSFESYFDLAQMIQPSKGGFVSNQSNKARLQISALQAGKGGQFDEGSAWKQMESIKTAQAPVIRRAVNQDVGNATQWEQNSATELLRDGTETAELAQVKDAYLKQFLDAQGNGEKMRKIISGFVDNALVKKEVGDLKQRHATDKEILQDIAKNPKMVQGARSKGLVYNRKTNSWRSKIDRTEYSWDEKSQSFVKRSE